MRLTDTVIFLASFFTDAISIDPRTTFPHPIFETRWRALAMPNSALATFTPLEYLAEESVLTPIFLLVSLIDLRSKTALSRTHFLVLSFIQEFVPPITPAITIGFSESAITIIESSRL